MTKLLIIISIPTATATPTLTPTPDVRGQQAMFPPPATGLDRDWPNPWRNWTSFARKIDFNASLVDGMYYYALRNYGVDLIQKQGKLENGICRCNY